MISIAVVEPDNCVRQTLCSWIASARECRCVCACATGREALAELPRYRPDVVLMDIPLDGASGIACTARLKERLPEVQVIMFTDCKSDDTIIEALRAGASGYLLKPSSRDDILRAVMDVREGGAPMTREIARRLVQSFQHPFSRLSVPLNVSPRERQILELLSRGLANKQIAADLGISYDTVCVHLRRIYKKLHVGTRTEAAVKYLHARYDGEAEPALVSVAL